MSRGYEPRVLPITLTRNTIHSGPSEAANVLVLVRHGYILNTLGIQSHQALYLDCSLSPPLASNLYPALQLVALTRRYCCMFGGPGRVRTDDLRLAKCPTFKRHLAKPLLSQLSYRPITYLSWHTLKDLNPD